MKKLLLSAVCFVSLTGFAYAQSSLFNKNNELIVEEKEDARITYEKNKFETRIKAITEASAPLYKDINQKVDSMPPKTMEIFVDYNEMIKQDMAKTEDKPAPKKVKINTKDKREAREYMYDNFSTGLYDDLISDIEDQAKKLRGENL